MASENMANTIMANVVVTDPCSIFSHVFDIRGNRSFNSSEGA